MKSFFSMFRPLATASNAANIANAAPSDPMTHKLTRREKREREQAMLRTMPQLHPVSRHGIFEFSGPLSYTYAQGNVPGGSFIPVHAVCHGHTLYLFRGHNPTEKPMAFFQIRRCEVLCIGLLVIPSLMPLNHVFKLTFLKKQFGAKSFFFKTNSSKELAQWLGDLQWRVNASDREVKKRFALDFTVPALVRHRIDETEYGYRTETATLKAPESVRGMQVRYDTPPKTVVIDDMPAIPPDKGTTRKAAPTKAMKNPLLF